MDAPCDVLEIFLQPGEFYFGGETTRIRTILGSCVAITLWHPRLRIGGMCHYMLSSRPRRRNEQTLDGRYADEAMEMFMAELRRSHTRPIEYHVKLFGGGSMFESTAADGSASRVAHPAGFWNARVGRELITRYGFSFTAGDLGGKGHRNVVLDLWSGDVWVRKVSRVFTIATADASSR